LKVLQTNDIWTWLGETFSTAIKDIFYYNGAEQKGFCDDFSSILISYPIIRQARIKNGTF